MTGTKKKSNFGENGIVPPQGRFNWALRDCTCISGIRICMSGNRIALAVLPYIFW